MQMEEEVQLQEQVRYEIQFRNERTEEEVRYEMQFRNERNLLYVTECHAFSSFSIKTAA